MLLLAGSVVVCLRLSPPMIGKRELVGYGLEKRAPQSKRNGRGEQKKTPPERGHLLLWWALAFEPLVLMPQSAPSYPVILVVLLDSDV